MRAEPEFRMIEDYLSLSSIPQDTKQPSINIHLSNQSMQAPSWIVIIAVQLIHSTDARNYCQILHFPAQRRPKKTIFFSSQLFSSHYYTKYIETRTLPPHFSQYTTARPHASRSQTHYDNFGWQVSFYTDAVTFDTARWLVGATHVILWLVWLIEVKVFRSGQFLADRTIGRAYGTVCRLSVCRLSSVIVCL